MMVLPFAFQKMLPGFLTDITLTDPLGIEDK